MMAGEEFDLEALIEAPFRSNESKRQHVVASQSSKEAGEASNTRHERRREHSRSPSSRRREHQRHSRTRSRSPRKSPKSRDHHYYSSKGYHYDYDSRYAQNSHQYEEYRKSSTTSSSGSVAAEAKPEQVLSEAQRDRRTVFCRQLAQRLEAHQLKEFCEQVGRVRDVRIVYDRVSRRSKGVAYVEFYDEESVPVAVALTGQKLLGIPIVVELTETEKNRLAEEAAAILRQEMLNKRPPVVLLTISNLNSVIGEADLRKVFAPFGEIRSLHIDRVDSTARVTTTAAIQFKEAAHARLAAEKMHNFELAGRALRVKTQEVSADDLPPTTSSNNGDARPSPAEEKGDGIDLLEGDITELLLRSTREITLLKSLANSSRPSTCLLLQHLYDPSTETEPDWDQEIAREVREECGRFGRVDHINVPKTANGDVFVRFASVDSAQAAASSLTSRWFGGRQIIALFLPVNDYLSKFPNPN